jgi:hypothetical protein
MVVAQREIAELHQGLPAAAAGTSRFFPLKREFLRFSPIPAVLAAKTVSQIKLLQANSRSGLNGNLFAPNRELNAPNRELQGNLSGIRVGPQETSISELTTTVGRFCDGQAVHGLRAWAE